MRKEAEHSKENTEDPAKVAKRQSEIRAQKVQYAKTYKEKHTPTSQSLSPKKSIPSSLPGTPLTLHTEKATVGDLGLFLPP